MKSNYKILICKALLLLTFCVTTESYVSKKIDISYEQNIHLSNQLLKEANWNYQKKDYVKTIELCQQSLNYFITFEGYYLMGMSYIQLNDLQNGLNSLKIAEKINPLHEQLLLTLGLIFSSRAEYDEALKRFETLLEKNPDDPVYLYRIGLIYKDMREYNKAIKYLEKANQEDFKYRENVILVLGDIYFELNDFENSEYYYNQLETYRPDSEYIKSNKKQLQISKLLEQGNHAFKNKRFLEAEKYFTEITKLEPKKPIGYVQLGILYSEMKEYNKSIYNFKKALELNTSIEHFIYLCKSYMDNFDIHAAKNCILESKKLYPKNEAILNLEAILYKSMGNYKKAISILNELLSINNKNMNAHKNLYLIYLEWDDLKRSEQHLLQVLELDKENRSFWEQERKKLESLRYIKNGDEFLKTNHFAKANQEYQKALAIFKLPRAYMSLGDLYYKMRNYKLAEENYKIAIKISNDSWIPYQKLLNFYRNTNKSKYENLKNEILNKSKTNPQLLILYTDLLIQDNQFNEALNINQIMEKSGKNLEIVKRNLGILYYNFALQENKKKNFKLSLEYINKALLYEPSNELYLQTKTVIEENIKYTPLISQLEKAEELFLKEDYLNAKKLYDEVYKQWNKPMILVRLAEIEFYMGNEIHGMKLIEDALKNKPHEIPILEALYNRMLESGKIQEAEEGFLKILSIKEDSYYSYYKLGVIALLRKNYKIALNYFEDAILYNKDFFPARIGRGIALYYLNELDSAFNEFNSVALEKGFTSEIAMLNVAIIHLNKNEMNLAKNELKKIINLFPYFSDAYYHLAYIEYENKNYEEAEKLLNEAINLQKKDLYYWGLIKVYLEIRKEKLPEITGYFLKTYPNSSFYERVKELYVQSSGSKKYYEISYSKSITDYNIIPFNDKFILYNDREVVSIRKNTEKIFYRIKLSNIKNVFVDHYLWVQTVDMLRIFDLYSGTEIFNKKWNQICDVYQVRPRMILTYSNLDCSQEKYLSIHDSSYTLEINLMGVSGSYVYFEIARKIYVLPWDFLKELRQNKIDEALISSHMKLLLELSNEKIKSVLSNENFLILHTEEKIYIINKDRIVHTITSKNNTLPKVVNDYIVYLEYNDVKSVLHIYKLDAQNMQLKEIQKTPLEILDNDIKHLNIYEHQVFYINPNRELCYFDLNTSPMEIHKFETLNQFKNGIITFHY